MSLWQIAHKNEWKLYEPSTFNSYTLLLVAIYSSGLIFPRLTLQWKILIDLYVGNRTESPGVCVVLTAEKHRQDIKTNQVWTVANVARRNWKPRVFSQPALLSSRTCLQLIHLKMWPLTGRLDLLSHSSFFWLLPPDYRSLGAAHPRITPIPLTGRQLHMVQGSSCHPRHPLPSCGWGALYFYPPECFPGQERGECGQWVSDSTWVQQGRLKVMLLQQERHGCEWNKPQGNNEF